MSHVLTLNAGSSSIKFALFTAADEPVERVRGQVEGLGAAPRLAAKAGDETLADRTLSADDVNDHASALGVVLDLVATHFGDAHIAAIGHRVVHGGVRHSKPLILDDRRLEELAALQPLAPLHQPYNLSGVEAARRAFPGTLQVACFDTAFHRAHPFVKDIYALPRDLYDAGVRRYGFHGLSYEYVTGELKRIAPHHAAGRVIVSHLGNGASMCAINGGQSVGSSMGFTALDGLPMGTRCGQLDPGVVLYLLTQKGMSIAEVENLLYRESGLKGLSGLSHDMRILETAGTIEADQAIDYFVDRTRREIGAMMAILSGLDALVFCGGIGENADAIRERICQGFDWVGLELDRSRNRRGETVISTDRSRVRIFVIRTNEEVTIARHTLRLLAEHRL